MTKTNLKRRIASLVIALATVLTAIPLCGMSVQAAADNKDMADYEITDDSDVATPAASSTDYNGGGAITRYSMTVYNERACNTIKGSLDCNEGITILRKDTKLVYFIQYSTPNGARRGYIKAYDTSRIEPINTLSDYSDISCVALVKSNTTVYYGNSTTVYEKAGSVDKGEYVVVISKNGNWSYIEYNTTSGRKRGYVTTSSLTPYHEPSSYGKFYLNEQSSNKKVPDKTITVYTGPTSLYVKAGSVKNENVVFKSKATGYNSVYFIVYNVTGTSKKKSGFIIDNSNSLNWK